MALSWLILVSIVTWHACISRTTCCLPALAWSRACFMTSRVIPSPWFSRASVKPLSALSPYILLGKQHTWQAWQSAAMQDRTRPNSLSRPAISIKIILENQHNKSRGHGQPCCSSERLWHTQHHKCPFVWRPCHHFEKSAQQNSVNPWCLPAGRLWLPLQWLH